MADKLNLYQKIVKVRSSIGKINKDSTAGKGSKFSYDYVSGSLILSKIKEEMNNQNLIFTPLIKNKKYERLETTNKFGKPETIYIVELDLSYKWINADNLEETFEIPFYAIGEQNDPSKAFGTALTYSERYVLLKMFNLPTDEDDADAKQPQQNKQNQSNQRQSYNQQPKMNENNNQMQTQDKGKLELTKQKATDLADVINSQDNADPNNPTTQSQILSAYLKKIGTDDITKVSNENLVYMLKAIEGKINNYKAK